MLKRDMFMKSYGLIFSVASNYPEGTCVLFTTCQVVLTAVNYTLCILYGYDYISKCDGAQIISKGFDNSILFKIPYLYKGTNYTQILQYN